MPPDLERCRDRATLRLTTTGRRSGRPHTVTVWFVVGGPRTLYVQHAEGPTTDWYRNLCRTPAVQVDLGDGPLRARATPVTDPAAVRDILRQVRRKYPLAWLIQPLARLRARGTPPVAARIDLEEAAPA